MTDARNTLESILRDEELASEVADVFCGSGGSGGGSVLESLIPRLEPDGADPHRGRLEAIVKRFGRPVLTVWNGTFERPRSKVWAERLEAHRPSIEQAVPSVGRIEILDFAATHLGTAWMISEDVAVTNRHVALLFARRGLGVFPLKVVEGGRAVTAQVDFLAERDNPRSQECRVVDVLYISDPMEPDIAFLRVEAGTRGLPGPLDLFDRRLRARQRIVVIGYPAYDTRNDAEDQDRIFEGIYDVKRIAPGEILRVLTGTDFTHDATTLGGNSGSCVLDLASGRVVGLHFSGREGVANWAVTSHVVREYHERYVTGAGRAQPPSASPRQWKDEAERAEWVADLSDRKGHDPDFLGAGELRVELPEVLLPDLALPLETGASNGHPHELRYTNFSCVMHRERRLALFTAVDVDGTRLRRLKRGEDPWRLDPRIPPASQWDNALYRANPLDRGHLVRRLDPVWGDDAERAERDTFFWTNCAPQHEALNRRTWVNLEDYILDATETHGFRAVVFSGPIYADDDPDYRGTQLPQAFWKVVVMPVEGGFGDGAELRPWATAYLLSQASLIEGLEFAFGEFGTFQVPVGRVRRLTGLDFRRLEAFDPLGRTEAPPFVPVHGPTDIIF